MSEEWRRIEGFPNYAISNDGRVMRVEPGMNANVGSIVKLQVHKHGYEMVTIRKTGTRQVKTQSVARLVAQHYVPNPLNLLEVNHIDGNKTNNHYQNLEWVDRLGQIHHAQTLPSWARASLKWKTNFIQFKDAGVEK